VFGWASSGGTAVPGLRPKLPALVVGVRGRSMLCGRATQDKTMLRGDRSGSAIAECRESVQSKRGKGKAGHACVRFDTAVRWLTTTP
jgi:hypothetical protein